MKRIFRFIARVFRKLSKLVDTFIISPIAKFFVRTSEFFSSRKTSKLEKYLTSRSSLVVISLLFAILSFYMIEKKYISVVDKSAEVLYNQKVNINYNEELYVIEGIPKSVDVTLVGRRMDVYLAKQKPIDGVTLDLTGYSVGSYNVGFKYEQAVSSVEYKVDPSSVNIRIYDKISMNKEVATDIIHKDYLDSKLNIDGVLLNRDEVIVKGASHRLQEVAIVKAIIDMEKVSNDKESTSILKDVPLVAYDDKGNKIDVEIVPKVVDATIKITSPKKEIPIKLVTEGKLDGVAIKSLTSNVTKIVVYGKEDVLNSLEYIPVKVDINGIKEDKTFSINIAKPVGVRELGVKSINVELKVDKIKTIDVANVPVDAININPNYAAQVIGEQNRTVTVIVNGSESVITGIKKEDIQAYVDLSGYEPGEYQVPILVKGNNDKVTYVSRVKEIKIKIIKK